MMMLTCPPPRDPILSPYHSGVTDSVGKRLNLARGVERKKQAFCFNIREFSENIMG
jgi:hypothetical protein